jgi:excisionase family DNA binding protein
MEEIKGKEFLSIREVADYLGVDYKTIYRLVQGGEIPAGRVGSLYRIRRQDIETYFERQQQAIAQEAARSTQLKCGRCLRLIPPYEVAGVCSADGCEEPICATCWEEDSEHRCRAHTMTRTERLQQARERLEQGELPMLLTSQQARRREFLYLSRVEAKLRSLKEIPHPEKADRPVRVANWDAIASQVIELDRFRDTIMDTTDKGEDGSAMPTNPRQTYRLTKDLALELMVYSDLAAHLKRGFVTKPSSSTTLFDLLSQAIGRSETTQSLTVLGLAATAGWEPEAVSMIVGNDGGQLPFHHRLVAPVLIDLDVDQLIYNQADTRLDQLAVLFSPEMAMDVVQRVMVEIQQMLKGGRTGVVDSELVEQGRALVDEVDEAFDRLVATGRYQVKKGGKHGRQIMRRSI